MRTLKDKKVLITGAASGIGRETAVQMADAGAKIVALDVNDEGLNSLNQEIKGRGGVCFPLLCDLANESEIEPAANSAVRMLGGLNILINNAGIGFHGCTHEMTHEERNRILQINLNSPFALFQHLIHPMMHSNSGHLVNVCSVLGLVPYQKTAAYCTSKYGLVGMTEAIRAEYGRWGLGVSMICPGFVDTPMLSGLPIEEAGKDLRKPSRWMTTTPDKIARKILKAILKNKRMVLATPLAHFLYHSKRLFPGTFDFVQSFKSSKIKNWFRRRDRQPEKSESSESGEERRAA